MPNLTEYCVFLLFYRRCRILGFAVVEGPLFSAVSIFQSIILQSFQSPPRHFQPLTISQLIRKAV